MRDEALSQKPRSALWSTGYHIRTGRFQEKLVRRPRATLLPREVSTIHSTPAAAGAVTGSPVVVVSYNKIKMLTNRKRGSRSPGGSDLRMLEGGEGPDVFPTLGYVRYGHTPLYLGGPDIKFCLHEHQKHNSLCFQCVTDSTAMARRRSQVYEERVKNGEVHRGSLGDRGSRNSVRSASREEAEPDFVGGCLFGSCKDGESAAHNHDGDRSIGAGIVKGCYIRGECQSQTGSHHGGWEGAEGTDSSGLRNHSG